MKTTANGVSFSLIGGLCILCLLIPASVSAATCAENLGTESFETGFGAWINVVGDDGDWTRNSGSTDSAYTGPSGAPEGAIYLYLESSLGQNPGYPGKTAMLDFTVDFSAYYDPVLSFYYHMYGATMGSLYVDVYDGSIWHLAVWSRSGEQQTCPSDSWAQAVVDLSDVGSTGGVMLRLRGVTGGSFNSDMAIDLIQVQAFRHETHYVDRDNATPAFPYTDWTSAATNIQDAVDAATSTDTVFVADGVYHLTSGIIVDKQIALRSVNGPDVTIVDGGDVTGCFNLGTNACLLSGFTIRHGEVNPSGGTWNWHGGGVYCFDSTPVVSNCVIRENYSFLPGGGMYRGAAYNCTFSSNSIDTGTGSALAGGAAYNCTFSSNTRGGMGGGTATDCIFSNNSGSRSGGGVSGGVAVDCTFSGNSAGIEGGGMLAGTAMNCIFTGNGAIEGGGTYDCTAVNCTFTGNEASGNGGGMNGGKAINCIIYYNQAGGSGNDTYFTGAGFSCASDLLHGSGGNITNAPRFADRFNENLRLTEASPCLNTGTNGAVVVLTDLDGLPRIVDFVVDMGAYEYQEIADSDGDRMSDGFELYYFGGRTNAVAGDNEDGDPQCNYDEYIAGTDPLDPDSCFMIAAVEREPDRRFVIHWDPVPGREYSIFWSSNLTDSFTLLEPDIPYPQGSYTDTVHSADSKAFYNLKVKLQD